MALLQCLVEFWNELYVMSCIYTETLAIMSSRAAEMQKMTKRKRSHLVRLVQKKSWRCPCSAENVNMQLNRYIKWDFTMPLNTGYWWVVSCYNLRTCITSGKMVDCFHCRPRSSMLTSVRLMHMKNNWQRRWCDSIIDTN